MSDPVQELLGSDGTTEPYPQAIYEDRLRNLFAVAAAAEANGDYATRNLAVFGALTVAQALGYPAGVRLDPDEPEWPVLYIELPTGQVSWHVPEHTVAYDGHSVEEKWQRVREYAGF